MNDKNIYIQLLVIIFFLLPLWLVIYYEIKNRIRTNNNLKRIHERNKRNKNNLYKTL
jgi:TRAP-type mannitol/chloroaromatic compound transport system permease small subunit